MTDLHNRIALAALERARNQRMGKLPRKVINSRTADKFVIRGYVEIFDALNQIGKHHGRSQNSEVVAAILESLQGYRRSSLLIDALVISGSGRRHETNNDAAELGIFSDCVSMTMNRSQRFLGCVLLNPRESK